MLIGATIALPFSWMRFYTLDACGTHLVHFLNDLFEATLFWNELTMLDEGWVIFNPDEIANANSLTVNRNVYYILMNNASIIITIPQLYNQCSMSGNPSTKRPILKQLVRFTSLFNSHIVE